MQKKEQKIVAVLLDVHTNLAYGPMRCSLLASITGAARLRLSVTRHRRAFIGRGCFLAHTPEFKLYIFAWHRCILYLPIQEAQAG